MEKRLVLGADIGGSHITAAFIDLITRSILPDTLVRVPVNAHGTANDILAVWSGAIKKSVDCLKISSPCIGIAMPGPFDYENGVSKIQHQDKYDALYNLNIKTLLAQRLGIEACNIRLLNDAACFLQGEVFGGAAQGYSRVIGLTLGTGLGSARYHAGTAEDAALWSMPFLDSIAEDYLVTRWFVKRYKELTGKTVSGARELAEQADIDSEVQKLFGEYGRNLGTFLANFIQMDNPEAVVIGGNIAKALNLFLPETKSVLAMRGIHVPLCKAILSEEAALLGAASCWK
ncbi:ROK family protein [Pontibacter sp. 172403-2]|uniref:ROK family protein n=1 Tax=Pontibacter rufus TaxID=2791028 RepID=UPI0018AFB0CE|nr:ROK family protein [Pontibacter sp. 172403-2]MBF9253686.1 ROK family protein [Pontibacter sp. 172403-2]